MDHRIEATANDPEQLTSLNVHESALSDDDKRAYDAAEARAAAGTYSLDNKTIREIISDQHAFEARE